MSDSIAENVRDQIENNEDFRDGFMVAAIMLRWEDEIVSIGKEKMRNLFEEAENLEQEAEGVEQ